MCDGESYKEKSLQLCDGLWMWIDQDCWRAGEYEVHGRSAWSTRDPVARGNGARKKCKRHEGSGCTEELKCFGMRYLVCTGRRCVLYVRILRTFVVVFMERSLICLMCVSMTRDCLLVLDVDFVILDIFFCRLVKSRVRFALLISGFTIKDVLDRAHKSICWPVPCTGFGSFQNHCPYMLQPPLTIHLISRKPNNDKRNMTIIQTSNVSTIIISNNTSRPQFYFSSLYLLIIMIKQKSSHYSIV